MQSLEMVYCGRSNCFGTVDREVISFPFIDFSKQYKECIKVSVGKCGTCFPLKDS